MSSPNVKRKLEDEAAVWLARMDRADVSVAEQAAFEQWRAASPLHDAAYIRLELGWQRFDRLRAVRPPGEAIDPKMLASALSERRKVAFTRQRWATLPRLSLVASLMAVAIGVGVYFLATRTTEHTFATARGEYRRVILDDESIVELNTATTLRVRLTRESRRIDLLAGEAHFTVAPDAARPFVVQADGTSVRALGTAFTVRRRAQATEVIVTEGRVAVSRDAARPTALSPGDRALAEKASIAVQRLSSKETERALAWQEGMLAFDGEALGDVVAEFNRYNKTQLKVSDPQIATLRIGGYFRAVGIDAFTATLHRNFGIRAERATPDEIRLLAPAEQPAG